MAISVGFTTSFEFDPVGIGKPLNMYLFLQQGDLEIAFYQNISSLKICSLLL